ncbi:MAG: DUF86 domain-containing protein [Deltaproteobacteria bacterium]|nr:DUF86 domain-containing protein [Deltaproteobacteria bacterium]
MVLRPESVRERLLKLEEIISGLQTLAPRSEADSFSDRREEWAAERGLQLGAEVLLDIGNHILSAHFGVSPQDYEDVVTQLAAHGVIDEKLHARLRGIGGFRNILVHDYLRIDPAKVADALAKAPRDFSEFALAIRSWLDRLT